MNQTPRELLLARHRHAGPALDAVRARAVARVRAGAPQPAALEAEPRARPVLGWLGRAWLELFWSCRRAWGAVAAGWAVVAVLHVASLEPAAPSVARGPFRAPAAVDFFLLQARVLSELADTPPAVPPAPPIGLPRHVPQSRLAPPMPRHVPA